MGFKPDLTGAKRRATAIGGRWGLNMTLLVLNVVLQLSEGGGGLNRIYWCQASSYSCRKAVGDKI